MAVHVISITITDAGGHKKAVNLYTPDTTTPANVQTFLTAHLPLLDEIISGVISAVTLSIAMVLPVGLDVVPLNDMLVDNGGLFGFTADGTQYRHGIFVPTINLALMNNDWSIPDAGDIQTWEQSVLSGEAVISLTNKHEQELLAFLGGERVNRKVKR